MELYHRSDLISKADAMCAQRSYGSSRNEAEISRCETVLNATLAEMDHHHSTKLHDFRQITTAYLDGEIAHHRSVLEKLQGARDAMDLDDGQDQGQDTSCPPNRYEGQLRAPHQAGSLPRSGEHVWDRAGLGVMSTGMRVLDGLGQMVGR